MDTQILWTKNENGTIDRVLGLNANTILTTNRNLSQLSDVDTTGAVEQNVLIYNSTTQKWVSSLPSFSTLSDVLIDGGTLSSSNVIKWSPAPVNRWVNRDLGYAVLNISGQIKDSVFNTDTTEWNVLDSANYETGTFTITSFVNNLITVDTTTNFQVEGLVSGANYRVEWNFNYNIATTTAGTGIFITNLVKNQLNTQQGSVQNYLTTGARTLATSLSSTTNGATALKFLVSKSTFSSGSFTGVSPLNVNMVISIIEM
jgi:hypothetical protein